VRPISASEIVPLQRYAALRDDYRQRVIAYKRDRRMDVGEQITLVFEDRETVRFQIQEMLFVERIQDAEGVAGEVAVYNELVPGAGQLSATLMIEITDEGRIRAELERLVGIDDAVSLVLGEAPQERRVRADFDRRQLDEDRVSAVHYLRFALAPADCEALADSAQRARLRIDHPHYRREDEIRPQLRAQLIADLSQEPAPLIEDPGEGAAAARERVDFELGGARVLLPQRPGFPGHRIVEPASASATLLECDASAVAALWPALSRAAREVAREHGSALIAAEAAPGAPLRFHVYAARRSAD
jgi:diadenosine tetraphosphate (Ap4A) HIT family hydrolase